MKTTIGRLRMIIREFGAYDSWTHEAEFCNPMGFSFSRTGGTADSTLPQHTMLGGSSQEDDKKFKEHEKRQLGWAVPELDDDLNSIQERTRQVSKEKFSMKKFKSLALEDEYAARKYVENILEELGSSSRRAYILSSRFVLKLAVANPRGSRQKN